VNQTLGFLFVYSLVDDENYGEGQVTILCTSFIRKSYENPFAVRSALSPSSLGLNDRAEPPGDKQVTERQFHTTPALRRGGTLSLRALNR